MDSNDLVFTFVIDKITVSTPEIEPHYYYTGEVYTVFSDTDIYTVSGDIKATEVGKYLVILTLIDPDHYKWEDDTFNGEIYWEIYWEITLRDYDMSGVSFNDLEVLRDELGKPIVNISDKVREIIGYKDVIFHISISHNKSYAIAFVTLEVR
jgi:hypothetical protein